MRLVLILDGNNLGFRAFGMAPMEFEGQRTEVMKISLTMVRSYLEKFHPDSLIITWDGGRDASRLALYPDYKKKKKARELTEVEKTEKECFFEQLRCTKKVFEAMGLKQYKLRGREADDVIYTLCSYYQHPIRGWDVEVISTDQDMYQLIGLYPNTRVWSPIKKAEYDSARVLKEFGVEANEYLYYKAMVGDGSDNLPGVRGVGPVAARRLVRTFLRGAVPSESDMKILDRMEEQLPLMLQLMEFRYIPRDEMQAGASGGGFNEDELTTGVIEVCQKYGFDQIMENLAIFLTPFEQLIKMERELIKRGREIV